MTTQITIDPKIFKAAFRALTGRVDARLRIADGHLQMNALAREAVELNDGDWQNLAATDADDGDWGTVAFPVLKEIVEVAQGVALETPKTARAASCKTCSAADHKKQGIDNDMKIPVQRTASTTKTGKLKLSAVPKPRKSEAEAIRLSTDGENLLVQLGGCSMRIPRLDAIEDRKEADAQDRREADAKAAHDLEQAKAKAAHDLEQAGYDADAKFIIFAPGTRPTLSHDLVETRRWLYAFHGDDLAASGVEVRLVAPWVALEEMETVDLAWAAGLEQASENEAVEENVEPQEIEAVRKNQIAQAVGEIADATDVAACELVATSQEQERLVLMAKGAWHGLQQCRRSGQHWATLSTDPSPALVEEMEAEVVMAYQLRRDYDGYVRRLKSLVQSQENEAVRKNRGGENERGENESDEAGPNGDEAAQTGRTAMNGRTVPCGRRAREGSSVPEKLRLSEKIRQERNAAYRRMMAADSAEEIEAANAELGRHLRREEECY